MPREKMQVVSALFPIVQGLGGGLAGQNANQSEITGGRRDDFNNSNTHDGFPLSCQSWGRNTQQYGRDLGCDKICVASLLTMHICVIIRVNGEL